MKVTILGTLPPITGISHYCLEQVNALSKLADTQFINFKSIYPKILYKWTIHEDLNPYNLQIKKNVKILPIIKWYNPFSWIKAGLLIDGNIFHFHWWTFYLFPIIFTVTLIAKIRRKKIVCTVHNVSSHESNIFDVLSSKILFKIPDHFIVHSSNNKTSLIKNFNLDHKKISIIAHGTLDFYKDIEITKTESRKKLSLENDAKIILFFGAIRKYKGVNILIKAFSEIIKQIPKAKLLIAGECWANWSEYDDLIKNLQLKQNIITKIKFIPTSEVKYFFTASDLLVLPYSHFESQTSVGTVGLIFNKPMVVTRVGGLPELVKNKECVVEPNNPKELAEAIVKVLKNEKFQEELEKDSGDLAKKYSWDKIAKKTINLYINVLNN